MTEARKLPRLLTRKQAAEHCGLTSSGFGTWMRNGWVPRPLPGTRRWDRRALDLAIDVRSGVKLDGISAGPAESVADRFFREIGYEGSA
jgi:hypothetical protein